MAARQRGMGTAAMSEVRRPSLQAPPETGSRGLVAALRDASATPAAGPGIVMARVARIAEHPNNPRHTLGDLAELGASIRQFGVRQPTVLVPIEAFNEANPSLRVRQDVDWVVLAGHRRRAAAELVGQEEIPAWIRADWADAESAADTFIAENIHRAGLAPLEEARAFSLLTDLGRSQRDIASRHAVSQAHVSKRLALLRLPQPVQDALTAETVSIGDALALTGVPAEDQLQVWAIAGQDGVPIASAVRVVERQRAEELVATKARARAKREGIPFVDDLRAAGIDAYAQRLEGKSAIARAKDAGVLVLGPSRFTDGVDYYTTAAPKVPDRQRREQQEKKSRDAAMKLRAAAAGEYVRTRKPAQRVLVERLATAVLHNRGASADALRLTHKWLGDSVGITDRDMYRWRDQVAERGDAATRLWVAWAITVAEAETHARWQHAPWDTRDLAYLQTLTEAVGYEPTPWETARLAAVIPPESPDDTDSRRGSET
jgi:ParB/RepB/Spo0J family partition protein